MKKIFFLIIGSFYSFMCMAQQVDLTDTVSISLPQGAEKLNKEQITLFINKNLDNRINPYIDHLEHVYQVNNEVLIMFNTNNNGKKVYDNYLLDRKQGVGEEIMTKRKNRTTDLKTINNNQVLVIYDTSYGSMGEYSVVCLNSANNRRLVITLEFNKTYKEKAKKMTDDIVQSLKFTN